jgi:hypothetical protein
MKDDIFNAGKIKDEAKTIADMRQEEEKQRRINFGLTFSTREGFEVLKDIAIMCHAQSISYVPGDQMETVFREGERNVFLYILAQLSDEMKSKIMIGG